MNQEDAAQLLEFSELINSKIQEISAVRLRELDNFAFLWIRWCQIYGKDPRGLHLIEQRFTEPGLEKVVWHYEYKEPGENPLLDI